MKKIDVVSEALEVVENCLTLVEIRSEVTDLLSSHGSKRICRCPNCRSMLLETKAWLRDMRGEVSQEAA